MTLPYEQYHALVNTRNFLVELCDPTNGHEGRLREEARRLLKHFPMESEANEMVRRHTEWADTKSNITNTVWETDPVEYSPRHGGWIFWNETWSDPSKAFLTRAEAEASLNQYCKELDEPFKASLDKVNRQYGSVLERLAESETEDREQPALGCMGDPDSDAVPVTLDLNDRTLAGIALFAHANDITINAAINAMIRNELELNKGDINE